MSVGLAVLGGCTFVVSLLLTALVRRNVERHGVIDIPNERSSHRAPTPRGGGIAIVTATTAALLVLYAAGSIDARLALALVGGGLAVAAVGFLDDRHQVPAAARFLVHVAAAVWALVLLGGLPPLRFGATTVTAGLSGYLLGTLAIVWVLNLFNFMDGIDGIAASEATFIAWAGALLARPVYGGASAAAVVLGAACLGFLRWNWAPARIFMGDVGSGYLGYVIAVLAVSLAHRTPSALWVWLILGGVFFVDATVTLLQRLLRGRRVYQAHRDHVYQWLARRWHSHARATGAALAVNLLWLFPCALLAARRPQFGAILVLLAFFPLTCFAIWTGGRRLERSP
jgi:Fuc2NAc and GlcNAc transferase